MLIAGAVHRAAEPATERLHGAVRQLRRMGRGTLRVWRGPKRQEEQGQVPAALGLRLCARARVAWVGGFLGMRPESRRSNERGQVGGCAGIRAGGHWLPGRGFFCGGGKPASQAYGLMGARGLRRMKNVGPCLSSGACGASKRRERERSAAREDFRSGSILFFSGARHPMRANSDVAAA